MITQHNNWAGNYTYQAARVHTPDTIDQVQDIIARSRHRESARNAAFVQCHR
ncbi:hypothetical protein HC776_03235 [bacterium]|nr:hypothetical protein [bacterium]